MTDGPSAEGRALDASKVRSRYLKARGNLAGALKKLDEIEKLILAVPNEALREISMRNLLRWKVELNDAHGPTPAAGGCARNLVIIRRSLRFHSARKPQT